MRKNGALSSDLVLRISAQIASALETAHKAHIIHRDIKPHNIVLNKNMVAKVTDFGIAKITNVPSSTITSFGSTMGSVHYFSPEHARGGYTDEKSDIYSLGVVMYEMATGKLPFDADSAVSVALKQIQEEPIEPIIVNPKVSVALNQIILKAMQKSTVKRYQSATELLEDISRAQSKPNSMIVRNPVSVEAGATQVIPILNDENYVPNLRTRQPRRVQATRYDEDSSKISNDESHDRYLGKILNQNNAENEDVKENSKKDDKKKRKKALVITFSLLIAFVVIMIVVFSVKVSLKTKKEKEEANREIDVPNLVGRSFEEVVEEYKAQNIEIIQDKLEYDSEVEEGKIISQTPEKGTKTKDKRILVVVSKGKKMVEMVDVTGKDIKVARYELENTLGFVIEEEEVINEKIAAGIIISQDIKKGESVPYGSKIKLTVSKGDGKETVTVPNVIGKTESDAKTTLENAKLTVNVKYGEDKTKSNGVVLSQSYPQNQALKEGTLVEITVNKVVLSKNVTLDILQLQGGTPLEGKETINVKVTSSIDGGVANTVYNKDIDVTTKEVNFEINGYNSAALKVYLEGKIVKDFSVEF